MKIEMTGVLIDRRYNPCCVEGCQQGADTAISLLHPGREQTNVCLLHLKEKLESGEWELSTHERELAAAKGGAE